jgi:hypothetical protein
MNLWRTEQRPGAEPDGPSRVPAGRIAETAPVGPGAVLALQRRVGNAAVARILAREAAAHADWSTVAGAQATAAATRARLTSQLLPYMVSHRDPIVRNTAQLFTGTAPLLTMDAITKRPDSALIINKPGQPAWFTAHPHDAFFTGTTITNANVSIHQPSMIGTLQKTVMFVRGHDASGTMLSLDEMAGVVTHECSHFFVSQYGELPQSSTNASSFDRYADEFRAYYVQHGGIAAGLTGADRVKAIREQLIGTAGDPNSGYSNLHTLYFAPGPNAFKAKVDALTGPLGYNLTNSIRLHALWQLLGAQSAGTATVDQLVAAVDALPATERQEAARASLIATFIAKLAPADGRRVRRALDAPTVAEYTGQLNPGHSGAVTALMAAIANGGDDAIKRAYGALSARDRQTVAMNAALLSYIDFHQEDPAIQAAVYAMLSSRDVAQYDAMASFVRALGSARAEQQMFGLTAVPVYVTEAMARLSDESRWSFFSWARTGALKQFVDSLPAAIANEIRERLRD